MKKLTKTQKFIMENISSVPFKHRRQDAHHIIGFEDEIGHFARSYLDLLRHTGVLDHEEIEAAYDFLLAAINRIYPPCSQSETLTSYVTVEGLSYDDESTPIRRPAKHFKARNAALNALSAIGSITPSPDK